MHRKELLHITDKRYSALQSHWPGLFLVNEEAIHDWRVELKKMRALVRLFRKFEKKASIHSSWKKLYDLTGEVRDRQVHLHLVQNLFDSGSQFPVTYVNLIEEELSAASENLKRVTGNDVLLHMYYQTITNSIPGKISVQKLKDYIYEQLIKARNILWLTYKKDDYLHECRKYLKDAQYLISIFDEQLRPDPVPHIPELNKIEDGGRALGEFQDQCVALKFFNASYLNRLPAKEKQLLKKTQAVVLKEKNRTKNSVISYLDESFKDFLHLHTS